MNPKSPNSVEVNVILYIEVFAVIGYAWQTSGAEKRGGGSILLSGVDTAASGVRPGSGRT